MADKNTCSAPGGKCLDTKTCRKLGRCVAEKASKPKRPGQVTGKGGGY